MAPPAQQPIIPNNSPNPARISLIARRSSLEESLARKCSPARMSLPGRRTILATAEVQQTMDISSLSIVDRNSSQNTVVMSDDAMNITGKEGCEKDESDDEEENDNELEIEGEKEYDDSSSGSEETVIENNGDLTNQQDQSSLMSVIIEEDTLIGEFSNF